MLAHLVHEDAVERLRGERQLLTARTHKLELRPVGIRLPSEIDAAYLHIDADDVARAALRDRDGVTALGAAAVEPVPPQETTLAQLPNAVADLLRERR